MPSSLQDAYMQAAIADSARRTVSIPSDPALGALGVHPGNALYHTSSIPAQRGLVNAQDFASAADHVLLPTALPTGYNETGMTLAQQRLHAEMLFEAALQNLRSCQANELQRQALLASQPAWNASLGLLPADAQAPQLLQQHLGGLRPQLQQQPQQRRRGRRGGVRQHAYRNGIQNRPGGPRPQGQPAQGQPQAASLGADASADQQSAAAISGGTGVFLPNRPQQAPLPARSGPTCVPIPAPTQAPLSRAEAICKARQQAAAKLAAAAAQQTAAAAYVPTSADLAASVRLAANGQLVHGGSLASSAYFMQDAFLSGNSSLASTVYTPTSTIDVQGLISQLSSATTSSGPASPRLTPMTTPRACDAAAVALRELIYPSSEDGSHSSANDLLFSQDASALLARAGSVTAPQSMLDIYNMRTSTADATPGPPASSALPARTSTGFGHLWDT